MDKVFARANSTETVIVILDVVIRTSGRNR